MENLELYNRCRVVPNEAQKPIGAGRLKGMTDINPMWRIQKLTELFGPCGIGWKYTIEREWIESGADGVVAAFMDISLYYKHNGEWSEAIPGTGGSSFVAKETNRLYTSDECYKMALTDAISVATKALGMGADIYWEKGRTKYDPGPTSKPPDGPICSRCGVVLTPYKDEKGKTVSVRKHAAGSEAKFGKVYCLNCIKELSALDAEKEAVMSRHEDAGDRV